MTLFEWLPLAALCFAGAASPGPSLAVVVNASINGGRPGGFTAAWSHALGVGLYAALTVFGLSVVITQQPTLFVAMQVAGALYLLWLALGLWRSAGDATQTGEANHATMQRAAIDGFAVAFLNPKLAVFMLALFSQFIDSGASATTNAVLIGTATLIDGVWYSVVTLMITRPGWVDALRRNGRTIDRVFGFLLAVLAITILARVAVP